MIKEENSYSAQIVVLHLHLINMLFKDRYAYFYGKWLNIIMLL